MMATFRRTCQVMPDEIFVPQGEQLVSRGSVPKLQNLAACEIALEIWYGYIARVGYDGFQTTELTEGSEALVDWLETTQPAKMMIIRLLADIRREMSACFRCFQDEIFPNGLKIHRMVVFDANWCVWFQNGRIDYKRTSMKVLWAAPLNDIQKFAVMCAFSMATEIKKILLKSVQSLAAKYNRNIGIPNDEYLFWYWIGYRKNNWRAIQRRVRNVGRVDKVLAVKCMGEHLHAFEYFWKRMSAVDQVSVADLIIRHPKSQYMIADFQKLVVSMPRNQLRQLFALEPVETLLNLGSYVSLNMPEFLAWIDIKDILNENSFVELIKTILSRYISNEFYIDLLLNVWDAVSDDFKKHAVVLKSSEIDIFGKFCREVEHSQSSFDFLHEFLSFMSAECRKELIMRNAVKLAIYVDVPGRLTRVVWLCLPNLEEKLEFVRSVMDSPIVENCCAQLLVGESFIKLILKLEFFSPNANVVRDWTKRVLNSNTVRVVFEKFIVNYKTWNKLSRFIDRAFAEDVESAATKKKQIVSLFACDCCRGWFMPRVFSAIYTNGSLDEMIKVSEQVFGASVELDVFKANLLNGFQRLIIKTSYWKTFDENFFNKFVSWCLSGDEAKIRKFRSTLPLDDIFYAFVNLMHVSYMGMTDKTSQYFVIDDELFSDLNKFLNWYFVSPEEAKKFKIERLHDNECNTRLFLDMQPGMESLEKLLRWFFDNDQVEINRFRLRKLPNLTLPECFTEVIVIS